MAFSIAQYQAVTDKLSSGNQTIAAKIPQVRSAANSVLGAWYVPGAVKEAVTWLVDEIVQIAEWLWNKIGELLQGVVAPIYMFEYAFGWQDIKGTATTVAGELTPQVVGADQDWQGAAATAYSKVIQPQNAAAAEIGTIANQTATALAICATGALAFYVALAVIVVEFIWQMVAAIIALGTVVFSWAGLALVVEACSVNAAMVWAVIATLTALLGTQASQMATLHGQAVDNSSFPGGHWPKAVLS
jgi:hypothetical protein